MQVSAPSFAATLKIVEREAARREATDEPAISAQDFLRSAAESRKEFSRERLKALRQQVTTLSLFAMKPSAMAQFSSQMAKELEGAASDFARSVRTLGEDRRSFMPETPAEAYQEIADTGSALERHVLTDEDRETAASFSAAARQIELLTDNALERSSEPGVTDKAKRARSDALGVVELMNRLDGKGLLEPVVR
ncbi:hypothetical protein E2A64_16345 [Pseudohoeflea suaedae]|uniref:Uncharacterized protein n=1 Tax=Pseudohoeflea suaedae TaxID=877384 RepID=A0A4R5PH68_9HYPH|nr:hypothetical protein [Pseudohoeflea suaedae]TDH34244.1 hypothetical protein E2A64_16345 [Pseudohoeflea suaedae]